MRNRVFGVAALLTALVAAMVLGGCAAQKQANQPSPEEMARIQDSIAQANERELKIARMFAYDKLKQNQWMDARRYLWKVVDLDVKHEYNDWSRLYQSYMNTNQADSAQIVLGMGLQYYPEDSFLASTMGFMLKTQGSLDSSLGLYKVAAKVEPENLDFKRKIAELFEAMQMPDSAIAAYESVIAASPDDQAAKDKLSYLLRKHRDPEEYIAHMQQEVANSPDDVEKRMELLYAYGDQNLNDKLIEQANEVIKRDANRLEAYTRKAQALENMGKSRDAIAAYDALLKKDPSNNVARIRIAENYRLLGEWTKSREWALKARKEAGGTSAEAEFMIGQIYEACSDECSKARGLQYDDKLVLAIAYGQYKKAAASEDYVVQEKANRRINFFETNKFIPQYSDWFMAQDKEMPAEKCYNWIKTDWSEVGFLASYLDMLSKSK